MRSIPRIAETYEARGIALRHAQKYDEAMESFNKAIELDPEAAVGLHAASAIRAIKGDNARALADVEQALKLQPRSVQALQLRATHAGRHGQVRPGAGRPQPAAAGDARQPRGPAAIGHAVSGGQAAGKGDHRLRRQLVKADPENAAGYRGRADAYLSLGNQAEAIEDYEAALKLDPKNSGVLNNLAWVLATSPDEELRDGKRAIELATLACEVTEYKQAHILSTLAAGYAETGDFDTAISWSKKAVDLGAEQLKGQLTKELESYQAHKPWRKASPPTEPEADQTAAPEKPASPASDDTAKTKPASK